VVRALAAARETAALKAAEARIRRDRSNLFGLIENTTDAIWSMDLECNVIAFNSAASLMAMKMTGQPMCEGAGFLENLPPGLRPCWEAAAEKARNSPPARWSSCAAGSRASTGKCAFPCTALPGRPPGWAGPPWTTGSAAMSP